MDKKYLTDSESLSLNIEANCLLPSSPRNFQYEIKMDKYNPYPSMISMFTSDSQHPPKSRHAVHLGVDGQSYPSQPLQPNYKADQFVDCYRALTHFQKDINVSRADYKKGYCLYVLDVDPHYSFSTKRRGHCQTLTRECHTDYICHLP